MNQEGTVPVSNEQVAEFRERGFLKVGRVLSDSETSALGQRLEDVLEGRSAAHPEAKRNLLEGTERVVVQVVNIWQADDLFRAHLYNPIICEMASRLMD